MLLLSLTVKLASTHSEGSAGFSLHIYQQLYKNVQKPDPFPGSCRVQLVTRALAEEALNSSHVALPVHCGFEDFIRVGQLLPLVRLDKEREGPGDCKSSPPRWLPFKHSVILR